MTETPADLDVSPPRPSPWRNLSLIWLVPILALIVSLGIAWRSYSDRGVLVEISFANAAGVAAGETTLRYRDVVIGTVESVSFTDDLNQVIVSVRVQNNVAPFLDDSAQFWVVRPQVSAQGISGLSTVLSGVYIEGNWDGKKGAAQSRFEGLDEAPLIGLNNNGTRITLQASDGKIVSAGAPIFYRGVQVGRTETPRLDETGTYVLVEAFIEAPHDRLLTTATRFWDTSGFSVSFGASGLKLDVESFASLLTGGVTFNTFFSGGAPVAADQVFELYADETAARDAVFARVSTNTITLATIFEGGVSGLSPGADLLFEGLRIGEVSTISAFVTDQDGTPEVKQRVTFSVDPQLLGLPKDAGLSDVLDFLDTAVANGLRARLNTANLLGSSLVVQLQTIGSTPPAQLDRDAKPYPIIPSVASDLPDLNATLEGVMKRVNALKIEELIQQATSMMASIEAIASSPDTRKAPEAVVQLLSEARDLIGSEETRALPGELRTAIEGVRVAVSKFNDQETIERLIATIENADTAAANLAAASENFPGLTEDLRAVAAKANALKAEELVAEATRLLGSINAVVGTPDAVALPADLSSALDQIRGLLAELREGGAVENTNSALASARVAAQSLERATEDLPALSDRIDRLVSRTEDLIAAYGTRSDFNTETLAMLREVRSAARTIAALTRALERNPNSILFGR